MLTLDDPEDLMIHKEDFIHMEEEMNKVLSALEKQVLALYLEGQSYQEISDELNQTSEVGRQCTSTN